ncbi:hypothetical protein M2267_003055 [Ensifer sp. KUDG1]|uniref:hypothetical protein n=1 Tax=Ensifer sp. KUDG1 TaxID=3373919 RepID=UPI003D235729
MTARSNHCSIENCRQPKKAKGLCSKHYQRLAKYGDPLALKSSGKGEPEEYFRNVVLTYDGDACLTWPYGVSQYGYAIIGKEAKDHVGSCFVSRLVCEAANGPPPTSEHQAAHSCGNGHLACVAKKHLSWKTPKDNSADRVLHGTLALGEKNGRAKLTEAQVSEILSLRGKQPRKEIAARFGVTPRTISDIHSGRNWKAAYLKALERRNQEGAAA